MNMFGKKTSEFELRLIDVASRVLDETKHLETKAALAIAICEMASSVSGKIHGSNFEKVSDVSEILEEKYGLERGAMSEAAVDALSIGLIVNPLINNDDGYSDCDSGPSSDYSPYYYLTDSGRHIVMTRSAGSCAHAALAEIESEKLDGAA